MDILILYIEFGTLNFTFIYPIKHQKLIMKSPPPQKKHVKLCENEEVLSEITKDLT